MTVQTVQTPMLQGPAAGKPEPARGRDSGEKFERALSSENQKHTGQPEQGKTSSDLSVVQEFKRTSQIKSGGPERPDETAGVGKSENRRNDGSGILHAVAEGKTTLPFRGEKTAVFDGLSEDVAEPDPVTERQSDGLAIPSWLSKLSAGLPGEVPANHVSKSHLPADKIQAAATLSSRPMAMDQTQEKQVQEADDNRQLVPGLEVENGKHSASQAASEQLSKKRVHPVDDDRQMVPALKSGYAKAAIPVQQQDGSQIQSQSDADMPPKIANPLTGMDRAVLSAPAAKQPVGKVESAATKQETASANAVGTITVSESAVALPTPVNGPSNFADAKPGPATNSVLAQLDQVQNVRELLATDRASFVSRLNQEGGSVQILKLHLRPAELGNVMAHMRMENGQMKVELIVEREVAYRQLAKDASILQSAMRSVGVVVEDLVISQGSMSSAPDQTMQENHRSPGQMRENSEGRSSAGRRPADQENAHDPGHENVENETNRTSSGVYI